MLSSVAVYKIKPARVTVTRNSSNTPAFGRLAGLNVKPCRESRAGLTVDFSINQYWFLNAKINLLVYAVFCLCMNEPNTLQYTCHPKITINFVLWYESHNLHGDIEWFVLSDFEDRLQHSSQGKLL